MYTKIPPIRPTNKTIIPEITGAKEFPVIKGEKNPASNAKNIIKYTYLKPDSRFDRFLLNEFFKLNCKINF